MNEINKKPAKMENSCFASQMIRVFSGAKCAVSEILAETTPQTEENDYVFNKNG